MDGTVLNGYYHYDKKSIKTSLLMVRVFNFVEQFPAISVGRFKNKRLRKVFLGLLLVG